MTSTEFTVGLGEGCRISSKVLKPPGGGSSDIFGIGNAKTSNSENGTVNSSTHSRLFGQSENPQASVNHTNIPETNDKFPSRTKRVYIRRNPITGEEIEINLDSEIEDKNDCDNKDIKEEEAEPVPSKSVQTSIRVRNPPGGKSSGIF